MVRLKTQAEIETLATAGALLADVLDELESKIVVGGTGIEIDELGKKLMQKQGVTPSFLGYGTPPYPAAVCVSVNDAVVHGLPNEIPFREGDIVSIDAGLIYEGMYVDSARTVPVGAISKKTEKLVRVTKESLRLGIEAARLGSTTGHIGEAVQRYVEDQGFGVVRQLVGHGVGHGVHEEPQVPNFGRAGKGEALADGLVIAIEPMVTVGDPEVETAEDQWTIKTVTGNLSAHEEHTVAITPGGPRILTLRG